jgi:lipase
VTGEGDGVIGVILHHRQWGAPRDTPVICVHGTTQHGGVFEEFAQRLVPSGRCVIAVDLRGHGRAGSEPPWDTQSLVDDILETLDALDISRATWVGHSYGGLLCATVAAHAPQRVDRLALLDPAIEIPPAHALASAEVDRLDWSFTSTDGAVTALLSSPNVVAASRDVVDAYVTDDLQRGSDGLLRFSFCRSAVVVLWSEMTRPAPSIAQLPTLIVRPVASYLDGRVQDRRYREELRSLLKVVAVPNGHNVLWESLPETVDAVERLLAA